MAKSFTDDGAAGAGGPAQATAPVPGAASAPSSPSSTPSATPSASELLPEAPGGGGGGGGLGLLQSSAPSGASSAAAPWPEGGLAPLAGGANSGGGSGQVPTYPGGGVYFDQGGGVPDDDNDGTQPQTPAADPMSAILQGALGSVDQVLQFGYQQYGLGGDQGGGGVQDQEAQPQQQAANMPTVPASQSNSGVPPVQPMPGPLPPTSNPFGKRMAANMPTVPASQSNSGVPPMQPAPGPLPPTNNPFGKRADAGGIQDDDQETS